MPPQKANAQLSVEFRDMFYSLNDAILITHELLNDGVTKLPYEHKNMDVPMIVQLLCHKITQLEGFNNEGIFRLSPTRDALKNAKKEVLFCVNINNVFFF